MHASVGYNIGFAAAVCVVCAVFVSAAAVSLHERQAANEALEKQRNVLVAAGLASSDERLEPDQVADRFAAIEQVVVDLESGAAVPTIEPATYDDRAAMANPETSRAAPPNAAGVQRVPLRALVYELRDETGDLELTILPVSGMGLWSTLYGFVALDADLETIRGLTFYDHGETPGLGGEVDNPRWKALWAGRRAFGPTGEVAIEVIKGRAGSPDDDPYQVDGLAGATMTSRGVTNLLRWWLGEQGFDAYLDRLREEGST